MTSSGSAAGRLALVFAVACAALPATAAAADAASPLSPPLEELAEPAVTAKPLDAQADRLGLPLDGPGSLVRDGGRVLVTARVPDGVVPAFAGLRQAGARILSASAETETATLSVAPARLPQLAAVPGVSAVWQVRAPVGFTPEGQCEGGAAITEGLSQLQVVQARSAFDLRGKGQTIGVLSDSYDSAEADPTGAPDDVFSGDLPGPAGTCSGQQLPVDVLAEGPADGGDEGRAMLQIVHDLAPHANLAFATAFESEESFAENIEALARPASEGGAEAGVIVDDVAWFEEPFFQDGPIAVAVDHVVDAGVTYLSAAGNDNLFDSSGNRIASWEAPAFRSSGGCPAAVTGGSQCMDFDPGPGSDDTFGITVEPHDTLILDLQWAEPWNGVGTNLDAYLLSGAGGKVLAKSTEANISGTQRPVEIVGWENSSAGSQTVQLAINRRLGASPRLKFILLENGSGVSATEYPKSSGGDVVGPAVFGHAGAASAIAVAAVPYSDSSRIERYSSRGPVAHLFGPVEGPGSAVPLGAPEVISKPDLAATDCGVTTFFASPSASRWRFCGTSAAAPHAAAVAALVRQAKPTLPPQQVRTALEGTAAPVGGFPADAAGAGRVDAFAAIAGLPGPIEGGDGPSEPAPALEALSGAATTQAPPAQPAPPAGPAPALRPSAPSTTLLRHPRAVVHARARSIRLVFRFGSDPSGAAFLCRIDGRRYRSCASRFARRYGAGRHALEVKAQGPTGVTDPTPVVFRFRVKLAG
ncbi:MAG TPA: S8 family serine peptidase [Solirubrobacterales bacterium]|nr:S8 family serine peptidase [Solirubrobacterales bacterium]